MDTRKLRHLHGTTLILDESNSSKPFAETKSTRTGPRQPARDAAAELVRRWNAYSELVKVLGAIVSEEERSSDNGPSFHARSARTLLQTLKA